MIESPREFRDRSDGDGGRPAESLARYSFHTGAELRPIGPDEPCPVLFRDIGPAAMACFLRGELRRFAGPYAPITYMRTEAYVEPYTDHEAIGRLVFLRPLFLGPWHSGVPGIYVARAARTADLRTVGFIPGSLVLSEAAAITAEIADVAQLREALGGRHYDAEVMETAHRLERIAAELAETEPVAQIVRQKLQSANAVDRDRALESMARTGLEEGDLCTAWHHLPRDRHAFIREALRRIEVSTIDAS